MSRRPIIHPYAEIGALSKKALDALGFRFTAIDLDLTKEGWLRLYVRWDGNAKQAGRLKYPRCGCTGSGSGGGRESEDLELEFPEIPAPYGRAEYARDHKATINLGVLIKTGRALSPARLKYHYQFFDCIKYGVNVWFSPLDWNDGAGDKSLFRWAERRRKEVK